MKQIHADLPRSGSSYVEMIMTWGVGCGVLTDEALTVAAN